MPLNKEYILAIAAGAGYTDVPVQSWCRYMTIEEDPAVAPVGLEYKNRQDNYTQNLTNTPGDTITLGDPVSIGAAKGGAIGLPSQAAASGGSSGAAATIPVKVRTSGARPGCNVKIKEYS